MGKKVESIQIVPPKTAEEKALMDVKILNFYTQIYIKSSKK